MPSKLTYKSSGVDIDQANHFVKGIGRAVKSTFNASVIERSGAFGGLFAFETSSYKDPVLVSSTDGVGTKLLIAQATNNHRNVGIDLVGMNVNDILCVGAKPLFFLDYIACGKVNVKVLNEVIEGIAEGCRQAGCSLVGGETAEMPGMYGTEEYDLAGFAVGVVERSQILDGSTIREGDLLYGLPSSGLHSNGFSLVRKVFSGREQKAMAKDLLIPTLIYVKDILPLLKHVAVQGIAHLTGGAFYEKLTKMIPPGLCCAVQMNSWPIPKIFPMIQKKGRMETSEMYRTFNMGIGLAIVIRAQDRKTLETYCRTQKIQIYPIGQIIRHKTQKVVFEPSM